MCRPLMYCGTRIGLVSIVMYVEMGLSFTGGWKWASSTVVVHASHQQIFSWEARDDLAAVFSDNKLLLDASRRPTITGRPEGLKGEDHALLNHFWMVERDKAAEDRFLPDGESDAMTVLEREGRFFIREAKLFCLGPELDNVSGRYTRLDGINGYIQNVTTVFVGIYHGWRGASYGK